LINAAGVSTSTVVVHEKGRFQWQPVAADQARAGLQTLLRHWQSGLRRPLPVATATAMAYLAASRRGDHDKAVQAARATFEDGYFSSGEVSREAAVARWYPDFDSLITSGAPGDDFVHWARALYGPAIEHHEEGQGAAA
ncbi:MAG: exodeoxyribonuclease V subunit gamma, partial [Wenzhouxiangella sp.]